MYCKFDHSEMIFGPFEKMTFLGEHPLASLKHSPQAMAGLYFHSCGAEFSEKKRRGKEEKREGERRRVEEKRRKRLKEKQVLSINSEQEY